MKQFMTVRLVLAVLVVALLIGSAANVTYAQDAVTLKVDGIGGVELKWLNETVKPQFEAIMKAEGKNVVVEAVEFTGTGEDLRQRYTLDIGSGAGADLLSFDGFWIPDFATAGLLKPLSALVGDEAMKWEGWEKTPEGLRNILGYKGDVYGIPRGTDARVIWIRTDLFAKAGLPADWQPTSWEDILAAARTLKTTMPEVTPLQLNAGKEMGEASTLQGYMMALLGAGHHIYDFDQEKWIVSSPAILNTLNFYKTLYIDEKLGDTRFQLVKNGRDLSFEAFAKGNVAMLVEGDFFWRGPLAVGSKHPAEMANRDEVVSFVKMPAMKPGAGYKGQDFVTISGGTGFVLNANTKAPQESFKLLSFMFSKPMLEELQKLQPRIRARTDVPVTGDAVMTKIAAEVLPLTTIRPALPTYSKVSAEVQAMTERVITGEMTPQQAMEAYAKAVEAIAGAENVVTLN